MKRLGWLFLLVLLPACARLSLPRLGGDDRARARLWTRAYEAFYADSLQSASAAFGQLAEAYPRSYEGREARFFMAALLLDPRNPSFDPARAGQRLRAYVGTDSAARQRPLWHRAEAITLLNLAEQFQRSCEARIAALRCETRVVEQSSRRAPGANNGASASEVERLQGAIAERDAQIQRLRDELERIRNTLVPRRP